MHSTHSLLLGNSSPIRDFDWFGRSAKDEIVRVAANRGASGIDGLIATGVGFATGTRQATTIVLGDLSTLHDLNSLALVAKSSWPIIVVAINNQAGGIFDLLPVSEHPNFEQYFATPHQFKFGDAAKMFGIDYACVDTVKDFKEAWTTGADAGQTILIEAQTDRKYNAAVRKEIADAMRNHS